MGVGATFYDSPIYNVCSKSKERSKPDLVSGVKRTNYTPSDYCNLHRGQTDNKLDFCGMEALWFEPKTS